MMVPRYIQKILDEVTGDNRYQTVLNYSLRAFGFAAVTGMSLYFMRKLIIGISRKMEYELRQDLYSKLLALNFRFYQEHQTGDIISRCTNDLNDVRTLLGPGIMYIPNSITRLSMFIPVLILLNGRLMLYIGSAMIFLVIFIVFVMPRMRPLFTRIQQQIGTINSRAWQVVSGINTVKLYTLEKIEKNRFSRLNEEYLKRQMDLVKFRALMRPFFLFVFSGIEFLLLIIGGKSVIEGSMTLGELLQFNTMVGVLVFPVLSLGWVMSLMQQGISAMARINEIFDAPVETRDDYAVLDNKPLHISCTNLSFSYPGNQNPGIRDITLEIGPGDIIGITGGVGSGKSTFIHLLSGILKPERGMIFINGIDIRDIDPVSIYRKIAVVPQEAFLFSATVAQNIGLGEDEIDPDDIEKAAVMAALERDIKTFPDGYSQIVGERGITLSGGQKQRMTIARAWRKNSEIMIFDDSLSSVDSGTAARIIENIRALETARTVILISHRIDVIKECDTIYLFHDGRITEQGAHDELVNMKNRYYKLWQIQNLEERIEKS